MDLVVARHTTYTLLSAGNRAEFQSFVWNLQKKDALAAERLWNQVFEVVHKLWPEANPIDIPGLPPIRKVVCTSTECRRCNLHLGGYTFPFLGLWSKRATVVVPGVGPDAAWEAYHAGMGRMDRMLCEVYGSGMEVADACPVLWDRTLARARDAFGSAALFRVRCHWWVWQKDSTWWIDPARGRLPGRGEGQLDVRAKAHRALWSWMASTSRGATSALAGACEACGCPAGIYCEHCGRGHCEECLQDGHGCCLESALDPSGLVLVPTTSMAQLRGSGASGVWDPEVPATTGEEVEA